MTSYSSRINKIEKEVNIAPSEYTVDEKVSCVKNPGKRNRNAHNSKIVPIINEGSKKLCIKALLLSF